MVTSSIPTITPIRKISFSRRLTLPLQQAFSCLFHVTRGSDTQATRAALPVLHLNRGMRYPESLFQHLAKVIHNLHPLLRVLHTHVGAHRIQPRCQSPDMEVVHSDN